MVVENTDFLHSPLVLELGHGLLLNSEDDHIAAPHSHGCGALLDGLLGVLDLPERDLVKIVACPQKPIERNLWFG